jgi:nucleoside-diphosphate-sugar epimerase
MVLELADAAVATSVIRPANVYGGTDDLPSAWFASARRDGAATYVGAGDNRLPLVHRDDNADLYALVIDRRARGRFHAVDGGAATVAQLARAASRAAGCGGATVGQPLEEARRTLGLFADAIALDQHVIAPRAHELGWRPAHAPFIERAEEAYAEWAAQVDE